jgi:hypothetical protein
MEQLASKNYGSFELLQEEVHMLRPPRRQWDEMNVEKTALTENKEPRLDVDLTLGQLEQDQALYVPFQDFGQKDFFAMIENVHSQLKMKVKFAPNSFFMGGVIECPGLVLLKRPLSRDDFERMWRPEAGKKKVNECEA